MDTAMSDAPHIKRRTLYFKDVFAVGERIRATAYVEAQMKGSQDYRQYAVHFEILQNRGLASFGVRLLNAKGRGDPWLGNLRRDLAQAVRDEFLKTDHYLEAARELGWLR